MTAMAQGAQIGIGVCGGVGHMVVWQGGRWVLSVRLQLLVLRVAGTMIQGMGACRHGLAVESAQGSNNDQVRCVRVSCHATCCCCYSVCCLWLTVAKGPMWLRKKWLSIPLPPISRIALVTGSTAAVITPKHPEASTTDAAQETTHPP